MDVRLFVPAGLEDNSYLLALGNEVVVVGPQRDAWHSFLFFLLRFSHTILLGQYWMASVRW